jgi:hypothetical protein
LRGAITASPQADPTQPPAQIFKQAPAPFIPLAAPLGPAIQNTLQSPEQPYSWIQGQTPPTALPPVITQLYGSPQLADLTLQPTLIKVDVDALTPPALRNTWFASPQLVDLTLPASLAQTFIPPLLVMPQRPATFFSTPQLVDLSPEGSITEVAAAQISVLLKVPNRPTTSFSAPQVIDSATFASTMFKGAALLPSSGGGGQPPALHDYNLGLSLMTLGGFRL